MLHFAKIKILPETIRGSVIVSARCKVQGERASAGVISLLRNDLEQWGWKCWHYLKE